jgi:hypothetical protein
VTAAPAVYRPGQVPSYDAAEVAYLDAGLPETLLLSEVQP